VRKAGGRVRITAQLIDATTGAHLWTDRFDGSLEEVFDLQDKIAVSVAGVIEPALQAAEIARSAARPTYDLTAYDLYLRALAAFYRITKERIFKALGLLEQAIAIDPRYGPALAWAAVCHLRLVADGWAKAPETTRCKGVDLARQAIDTGENDPGILVNAAFVLAYFGENIGTMIGLVDRALTVNPSFAHGWYLSGLLKAWAGYLDLAIEHVEASLRLSPREHMCQPTFVMGAAYFFKRRLTKQRRNCSYRCKTTRAIPTLTAFSPRAMPIWGGSTKRMRSSPGCAPLPLWLCRAIRPGATPSTASCSCPACAWRRVRRNEPGTPSRRDSCRRFGGG
jgi:tetratricopeptide (TPR) repeat protein